MTARVRVLSGLVVLAAVQLGAWLTYRMVEARRTDPSEASTFVYEPMSGAAPDMSLPLEDAKGRTTRLSEYKGMPLLVHFWATWCAPCRTELPRLLELANSPVHERRMQVFLISVDENWDVIRHYFAGNVPPSVLRDSTGRLRKAYGASTLPETFVVRQEGILSARVRGAHDWSAEDVRVGLSTLVAPVASGVPEP